MFLGLNSGTVLLIGWVPTCPSVNQPKLFVQPNASPTFCSLSRPNAWHIESLTRSLAQSHSRSPHSNVSVNALYRVTKRHSRQNAAGPSRACVCVCFSIASLPTLSERYEAEGRKDKKGTPMIMECKNMLRSLSVGALKVALRRSLPLTPWWCLLYKQNNNNSKNYLELIIRTSSVTFTTVGSYDKR